MTLEEQHLADAKKTIERLTNERKALQTEVWTLAKEIQRVRDLEWANCLLAQQNGRLERELTQVKAHFAALIGCARDNQWQGVGEGMHAYLWQFFTESPIGKVDTHVRSLGHSCDCGGTPAGEAGSPDR